MSPSERHTVVAIDGPAASGKSSTAAAVAETLGFRHVDSGSLYRAVTLAAIESGVAPDSWTPELLLEGARSVELDRNSRPTLKVLISGRDVSAELRSDLVTHLVSSVAQVAEVRRWVGDLLRALAERFPLVVDGRDIGTAVFPDADLKVYLVAAPQERARRRLRQRLGREPSEHDVAVEEQQLIARDARDAVQSVPAPDAIRLDTTALRPEEQVRRIVDMVRSTAAGRSGLVG